MHLLENKTIKLRALEPDDIDLLYKWENNAEIWEVSNITTPFSKHALKNFIENAHLDIYQTKQLKLMVEVLTEKRPVGLVDLFNIDAYHRRAEVGVLIHENERDKGYASECIETITKYAFTIFGLKQLYCNIAKRNSISLQVFQKCGYEIIGLKKSWQKTFDGWEDEYLLQKLNPKS